MISIPRLFHRIWLGPNPMPDEFVAYGDTWRRHHPQWQMKLWIDDNLPPFTHEALFHQAETYAQKADILRYELLHQFGGVYIDTDFECLRPIDRLLDEVSFFYADQRAGEPAIGILGAVPRHALAEAILAALPASCASYHGILDQTGPPFFARTLRDYLNEFDPCAHPPFGNHLIPRSGAPRVTAFYKRFFYPYWLGETYDPSRSPEAFAVHHWAHSWR